MKEEIDWTDAPMFGIVRTEPHEQKSTELRYNTDINRLPVRYRYQLSIVILPILIVRTSIATYRYSYSDSTSLKQYTRIAYCKHVVPVVQVPYSYSVLSIYRLYTSTRTVSLRVHTSTEYNGAHKNEENASTSR